MSREGTVLKCVLFDLDDTLVPETRPEREALLIACGMASERYGTDANAMADTVDDAASKLWGQWSATNRYSSIAYSGWEGLWGPPDLPDDGLGNDQETISKYKRDAWTAVLAHHGISDDELRDSIIERHRVDRIKRLVPNPWAEQVLQQLSADHRLGLVTNGSPAVQRFKLARSGLTGYFSTVVASGDVGVGKPDSKPFLVALSNLGVRPEESVMIGNSWKSDVQGANALGIPSIWFNEDGLEPGGGTPATFEIASLLEIPDLIKKIGA
ncbi:MAG: HAD family hydrolase [Chloroflexi bacterium]|nr:HAD family hydrolase [Chloroflexota bacterium]